MKKLLTALFLLYASLDFAQITLEHQYPGTFVYATQIGATDWNYYTVSGYALSIYDINHTLIKSITIPNGGIGTELMTYTVGNVSTNLFNTDSYYEYSVQYSDTVPPYGSIVATKFYVYNELGTVLFSLDSTQATNVSCYNTNAGIKMIANQTGRTLTQGNVYSLGGNFLSTAPEVSNGGNGFTLEAPYPNPSNNMIHLAYSLPEGTDKAEMIITNISGQVVKTCNVGSAFTDMLLDTKQYPAGEYFYSIHTGDYTSPTSKFIITK